MAINEPFVPASEEMEDALALHESDYAFLSKRDQLDVPVDVKKAYEKLKMPEFRKYARRMSWLACNKSVLLDTGKSIMEPGIGKVKCK